MRTPTFFLIVFIIASCGIKEEKAAQKEKSIKQEYLRKGEEIAILTQSELLKNVSTAMKTGGPAYAVDFCHLRAMPLKDSLSQVNNCQIKRIALKYRNPADQSRSETERDQLNQYLSAYQNGDSLKPEIYLFENRIEYYQPILINNGACLLCHGIPGKQISEQTLKKIKLHYPDDLATGFALNDFRGAWKITFLK